MEMTDEALRPIYSYERSSTEHQGRASISRPRREGGKRKSVRDEKTEEVDLMHLFPPAAASKSKHWAIQKCFSSRQSSALFSSSFFRTLNTFLLSLGRGGGKGEKEKAELELSRRRLLNLLYRTTTTNKQDASFVPGIFSPVESLCMRTNGKLHIACTVHTVYTM